MSQGDSLESAAKAVLEVLSWINDVSGVFPPLKAAVSAVVTVARIVDVSLRTGYSLNMFC